MKRAPLAITLLLLLILSVFGQGGMGPGPGTPHAAGGGFTPLALRFDGNTANALRISSGTFDYNANYTCMGYAQVVTDTNAVATIFIIGNQGTTSLDIVQTTSDGTTLKAAACISGTCANSATFSMTVGTWYHWAVVRSAATALALWVDGNLIGTTTQDITGRSAQTDINLGRTHCCGGVTVEPWNGRIAAAKCWTSAFNEAAIEAEMNNYDAQAASPWGEWYLAADGADSSGNGRNFTVLGTLAVEAGPSISQ